MSNVQYVYIMTHGGSGIAGVWPFSTKEACIKSFNSRVEAVKSRVRQIRAVKDRMPIDKEIDNGGQWFFISQKEYIEWHRVILG